MSPYLPRYAALFCLWLCLACGDAYEAEQAFAGGCWPISDTLSLPAPAAAQSLRVDLRFAPDFPYRNLYLKLMASDAQGVQHSWLLADTLLDPMGNWQAESNWDGSYPFRLQTPDGFEPPEGEFRWQLTHFLRDSSLCGVEWVGLAWE